MSDTIQQFSFQIIKRKKGDYPFPPRVYMVLNRWITANNEGPPVISHDLYDAVDIDQRVQDLKADLDAVGEKAKAALRKATEDEIRMVSEKAREPKPKV